MIRSALSAGAAASQSPCPDLQADIDHEIRSLLERQGKGGHEIPRFFFPSATRCSVETLSRRAASRRRTARAPTQGLTAGEATAAARAFARACGAVDAPGMELVDLIGLVEGEKVGYGRAVQLAHDVRQDTGLNISLLPSHYLRLARGSDGAGVSLAKLLAPTLCVGMRLHLWQNIAAFDSDFDGFLERSELETLLGSLTGEYGAKVSDDLRAEWEVLAPRKILFHLSQHGKVPVSRLACDEMLDSLTNYQAALPLQPVIIPDWFDSEKTFAIASKYNDLDEDGDGLLGPAEMRRIRLLQGMAVSSMTPLYVARLFECHAHAASPTGRPHMDLADFADFLLAWNYRGHPPSVRHFFRVLDLEGTGKLTHAVVDAWCQQVYQIVVNDVQILADYRPEDVRNEVFDMAKPAHPGFITLADLLNSHLAEPICSILVDAQCYYEYEQRESMAGMDEEEEEDGG